MMGVPARRKGWMCRCGVRLELPVSGEARTTCTACQRSYTLQGAVVAEDGGAV
jgi:UDP-2-acetamido-3-amino-2,3-dideoxy-glucuronate N-acetyltransferase